MLRALLLAVALLTAAFAPAAAGTLAEPTGRVILTVSGRIENTNAPGEARFDREMLMQLGWTTIETHTYFTEGPQSFSGIPLGNLLAAIGAGGESLDAIALNDYAVVIPVADAAEHGVFLALDHNGAPMRIRDKGPIWVIYPLEAESPPREDFNARMIWQLNRIEVE